MKHINKAIKALQDASCHISCLDAGTQFKVWDRLMARMQSDEIDEDKSLMLLVDWCISELVQAREEAINK